ncbi:MAG: hypothetical protein WCI22_15140, partial [Actinomycetota bacterium]
MFQRPDGLQEVHSSSMPVNYQDAKGVWQPVDNHLVSDGKGGFTNKANSFKVSFGQMRSGGGVQVSASDGAVGFVADGADATVAPVLSADGLSVSYPNVVSGSDLVYSVTGAGLEEKLVVKTASSTPSVSFTMSGPGIVKQTAGLRGGGNGLAARVRVSRPDTYDAKGRPIPGSSQVFAATDVGTGLPVPDVGDADGGTQAAALAAAGDTTTRVRIGVDPTWMASQPSSAFPLVVDPSLTVVISSNALFAYGAHTSNGAAYTTFNDGYARTGNPGMAAPNADVAYRTVVRFPYESYYGANSVENAFLSATITNGTGSGTQPLT